MPASVASDRAIRRDLAIYGCIDASKTILACEGITRASLGNLARQLAELATESPLFSFTDFPLPAGANPMRSVRYRLNRDAGEISLYVASMLPGKTTIPHNHGTWAVIVAVSGEELNRVYRVTEDPARAGYARLDVEREIVVCPGNALTLMPEDVHSIHVVGPEPALHIHMYGRPIEECFDRLGYEPETGRVVRYGAPLPNCDAGQTQHETRRQT